MQSITISRDNALKAYNSATPKQKKLLSDLLGAENLIVDIKERVKSYEDACMVVGIEPLTVEDFSSLPECDRESTFAHHQITIISKALNEGWTPNWADSNQAKFYPWFRYESGAGSGFAYHVYVYDYSGSYVGSRLVYKSRELAEYAGKQFESIYNKFLI